MLHVFNQYNVVDIHLSAPQCDWLPASLFTTVHLQQIREIWKLEYLLGINVKSTLHSNICRLSSYPWVRREGGRYIPDSLVRDWSRRCVNNKQHNVQAASIWSHIPGADRAFWQSGDPYDHSWHYSSPGATMTPSDTETRARANSNSGCRV